FQKAARAQRKRCCIQPVKLPRYWICDSLRAFVSFVEEGPLVTLSQETGEILTIELRIPSREKRDNLIDWLCQNCRQEMPGWVNKNCHPLAGAADEAARTDYPTA
ncbi:MAG TPA: hypothetical protein VE993_05975, partial [Stellaceae bacterium]|nr:hypothetical protein [Stellaceae bacterium]